MKSLYISIIFTNGRDIEQWTFSFLFLFSIIFFHQQQKNSIDTDFVVGTSIVLFWLLVTKHFGVFRVVLWIEGRKLKTNCFIELEFGTMYCFTLFEYCWVYDFLFTLLSSLWFSPNHQQRIQVPSRKQPLL